MRFNAVTVFVAAAALGELTGCRDASLPAAPLAHQTTAAEAHAELLRNTAIELGLVDEAWMTAADTALANPTFVELPYAEWGGFLGSEPDARSFAFTGSEGQVVKVALAQPAEVEPTIFVNGNVRVELFLAQRGEREQARVRLAEMPPGGSTLWFRLPAAASYIVRLQPEPLTDALYRFSVELEAALPFPVKGRKDDAVGSMFGMPRDSGKRHHEGVDIFAPRLTPVLAVADGRATPRENELGGNIVWLSTPGVSYYYAHLERAAVAPGQHVRAGDVIGFVGNSGNAITTDPHLHFGVYRWGKGAIDPLPLLQARRFAKPAEGAGRPVHLAAAAASARRDCGFAPRLRGIASYGCAQRIGAAVDAETECLPSRAPATDDRHPIIEHGHGWQIAEPLAIDGEANGATPLALELPHEAELAIRDLSQVENSVALACGGTFNAMASSTTAMQSAARIMVF
jgi:murein DD-endopeptidase MepM/ murein hydrolase activator NlpD